MLEVNIFHSSISCEAYSTNLIFTIQAAYTNLFKKDHKSAIKTIFSVLHHPQCSPASASACLMYSKVVAGATSSCPSSLTNVIQRNKINYFCNSRKAHSELWNTKYTDSLHSVDTNFTQSTSLSLTDTETDQIIQKPHLHPEQSVLFRTEVIRRGEFCSAAAVLYINAELPWKLECLLLPPPTSFYFHIPFLYTLGKYISVPNCLPSAAVVS